MYNVIAEKFKAQKGANIKNNLNWVINWYTNA